MQTRQKYFRKRRKQLMEEHPFCSWCPKRLKMYPDGWKPEDGCGLPNDFPTIDHIYSRFWFWNGRPQVYGRGQSLVLSCPPCNQGRAKRDEQEHIWRHRWKTGSFPPPLRWVGYAIMGCRAIKKAHKQAKEYDKSKKH